MELKDFFEQYPKVAIAFSGGVDSAYLLYAAKMYAKEIGVYYVKSPFQPQFELEDALKITKNLNICMNTIEVNILLDSNVTDNPWNRCYFCKKQIFTAIYNRAKDDGYTVLLDGTNASDDVDDRPGMKVLQELKVFSPLRMCGLTKAEIRKLSKEAELFTWNKPAYACLATRIPTGQKITKQLLYRTEMAEEYLHSKGFSDFRVRTVGEGAKIQIVENQIQLLLENREDIFNELKKYYKTVCLDLEMRNEN